MSKYELDDEQVRACLHNAGAALPRYLAEALSAQVPAPTPTKIGAVVRTEGEFNGGHYMRWAHDNASVSPWVQVGNHEEPYRTDEIGRIVEVLSEGVDL